MQISHFTAELRKRLETYDFSGRQTDIIEAEIKSILGGYMIVKSNRKTAMAKTKNAYRVRYKVFDSEKGIWIPKYEIKEALYAKDAKNAILSDYPGCKVSSAWLLDRN